MPNKNSSLYSNWNEWYLLFLINFYTFFLDESVLLAKSIIELLSEIVEWVPNKTLEGFIDEIIDLICAYLQTDIFGIYEDAAKCLWKLASRKNVKAQETPIVISMFRDNPMQIILSAAK